MPDVERYLQVFESLRQRKRWDTDVGVLRFAALTLAATDVVDPGREVEQAAGVLRELARWSSPLRSSLRFVIAAMIVRRGLDPKAVHRSIEGVREEFRRRRMRRGGTHELLAALMLVLHAEGRRPETRSIGRVKENLARWKKDHRFLTGSDDYPLAALHATRELSVEELGIRVERIYQQLRKARYSRGNQLQLASHLLAIGERSAAGCAQRFDSIARALGERKVRPTTSRYDEIAILSLTALGPAAVARAVVSLRDRLRAAKPRPSSSLAFSLAAGLFLAEDARRSEGLGHTRDLAAVRSAQAVIEAQQAAMIAAMSAATVAASAASS
ncbi:MAG: DUF4003 domain-containing protein [Acidobacteriota bacterium]|nr:DUF4003 domain-containing protein [Acidobacteriota bacterium]